MPASPRPPADKLTRKADRYIVLLGDTDGNAPTVDDECRWLVPVSVSSSIIGERLDTITCRVDFGADGAKRLQDTTSPVEFHRQIEVRRLDDDGEPTEVVGWGMIASDGQSIGSEEGETVTARLDHFLFGDVLHDVPYWDPIAGAVIKVHLPAVLNPTIDDKFEKNKSDRTNADADDSALFYHPESHRLSSSSDLQEQTAEEWNFKHAVHWLCWHLNPDETYITNPTIDELEVAFATTAGFARIRNLDLKYGRSLPQLLHDLLTPFGFGCNLVHSLDGEDRVTKFRFFERGKGQKVRLRMQRIGETISPSRKTNVSDFKLDYDIAKLSNEIIGHGAFKLYEGTFQLVPGWDPSHDDENMEDLETGQAQAVEKRPIGRKFVANEAGDYTDLREWIERLDLDDIFGTDYVIRRRRFRPCLSTHESGDEDTSNGYVVEWWDEDQEDATNPEDDFDTGWVRVKDPFQVLEKECGILFTRPTPPGEFLQKLVDETDLAVKSLYLRITCSIESDKRLSHTATKRASSPNAEIVPLYLDLHDRFKLREVDSTSIFVATAADTQDDQTKLETYLEKVRDNNDQGEVSLSVKLLTSNHPEYKIGQLIEKVEGRNLTFNANAASSTPRELQIVGINLYVDSEQRTELLVESFELERRELQVST